MFLQPSVTSFIPCSKLKRSIGEYSEQKQGLQDMLSESMANVERLQVRSVYGLY